MNSINNIEKICEAGCNLFSPVEDYEGNLYLVAQDGDILKHRDGQITTDFHISGQLNGMTIDKLGKTIYIADMAHQAILTKFNDDKTSEITPIVKDYEGMPLLGPHSIILAQNSNTLYFTDSGPMGETSLDNPKGSLYYFDMDNENFKHIALNCLAYPTGIALSLNEKNLYDIHCLTFINLSFFEVRYLCETGANRLLRFVQVSPGVYFFSVFHQFTAKFGPTAIAVSASDMIYVARYEVALNSPDGLISILNKQGQLLSDITIPNTPEITGLAFSKLKSNILYLTENSNGPSCIRIYVQNEESPNDENNNDLSTSFKSS